jgi:hypothetical protein
MQPQSSREGPRLPQFDKLCRRVPICGYQTRHFYSEARNSRQDEAIAWAICLHADVRDVIPGLDLARFLNDPMTQQESAHGAVQSNS